MRILLLVLTLAGASAAPAPVVLPNAHAHNDYYQRRPLLDALAHGFMSVEADVCLVGGELRIGHEAKECREGRDLESLYLRPLAERVRTNGGRVHAGGLLEFQLLVDFKSDGMRSYAALVPLLEKYRGMLTSFEGGVRKPGAVLVVLSGRRPQDHVAGQRGRLCALDGWFGDVAKGRSRDVVPLLSSRWGSHFRWKGFGAMPIDERIKLRDYGRRARGAGRKLRFWAVPHNERVWQAQLEEGVSWLNIDDLTRAQRFLRRWQAEGAPRMRRRTSL